MRKLAGAVLAMLLVVTLSFTPTSAAAMGTATPTVTTPTNGAVVHVGIVEVAVDFTDAPAGVYDVTLSTFDGSLVDTAAYNFDGSNPQAALELVVPITEPGAYTLRVLQEGGTVVQSSQFSAIARPGPPTEVAGVPSRERAGLVWQPPADDGGSPVLGYQVQRGQSFSTRRNLSPMARSHSFRNLTNGRRYTLYVRAYNEVGSGPWVSATATPARRPDAPARTRAAVSSHRARLYWGYAAGGNGGARITAYQVQRGSNLATRTTRSRTARSHPFRGLTNGATYRLYVRARNWVGYGPWARVTVRPRGRARPTSSTPPSPPRCTPGYSPCLRPASDYDCAGGSGNGPKYAQGPIRVTGSDPYDLDSDGDGVACED